MGGYANGTNNLGPNGPMNGPPPNMMMGPGGFIGPMGPMPGPMGMMGMDPSSMNQGALAEALMAQNQLLQNMMSMMQGGMMPNIQGMSGPMGPNGPNGPPMPPNGHGQGPQRGRGRGRGGRGGAPADGGHQAVLNGPSTPRPTNPAAPQPLPPAIQAPQPKPDVPAPAPAELPNRPLSPTLCKFGVNCTNSLCRYSHPSAAATQESGIVLSTEACSEGRFCKDKDCKLSHPSSATGTPRPAFPKPQDPLLTCSFQDLHLLHLHLHLQCNIMAPRYPASSELTARGQDALSPIHRNLEARSPANLASIVHAPIACSHIRQKVGRQQAVVQGV